MKPDEPKTAYYGLPMLHAPVWTWQIGAYFFVGGAAGMSAVIAFAGAIAAYPIGFVRGALALAFAGAVLSPALLIWDLGRPSRFLHMLRVFKPRSAMSVGVWTLLFFSGFTTIALVLVQQLQNPPTLSSPAGAAAVAAIAGAALTGAVLATYTGVLLGATAVPVWSSQHRLLPVHFGVASLGSAAALLEVCGYGVAPLNGLGLAASASEIVIAASFELRRHGTAARALRAGMPGFLLRTAAVLTGPAAFVLRIAQFTIPAAACFIAGAILSRYGWLLAGRASTLDPAETLATQANPAAR